MLTLSLKEQRILELGAGSGLISAVLAREGAKVLATDINPNAIASMEATRTKNQLNFEIIHSDLFQNIRTQQFDIIVINPPFFPQEAQTIREQAFFCGPNFEYFYALFQQLLGYISPATDIYMILTDDCALEKIEEISKPYQFQWEEVYREKIWGETNFIYKIKKNIGQ